MKHRHTRGGNRDGGWGLGMVGLDRKINIQITTTQACLSICMCLKQCI